MKRCERCGKKVRHGYKYCSYTCINPPVEERFLAKVKKTNSCWLWNSKSFTAYGYGRFSYKGKPQKAHRVSFELFNGIDPKNKHVLHKCDNPRCVNPNHLYLGNDQDNANDRVNRGRTLKGDKSPLTKFKFDDIEKMRAEFKGGLSKKDIRQRYKISRRHLDDILKYKWRVDK